MGLIRAFAVLVIWMLITFGVAPQSGGLVTIGIGWQFVLGSLLALAVLWRWPGPGTGLGLPDKSAALILILPLALCLCFVVVASKAGLPATHVIALIALNSLLIGISEEVMFRGILFGALREHMTVLATTLLSSAIFGVVHVANTLLTGDLRTALVQALAAALLGTFFAALRLRTGSLWPGILIHALWNAGLILIAQAPGTLPIETAVMPLFFVVTLTFYAAILWRRIEQH